VKSLRPRLCLNLPISVIVLLLCASLVGNIVRVQHSTDELHQILQRLKLATLARHDMLDLSTDPACARVGVGVQANDERAMDGKRLNAL
jgi:hypothetical protein